jgi:hypothetical protein
MILPYNLKFPSTVTIFSYLLMCIIPRSVYGSGYLVPAVIKDPAAEPFLYEHRVLQMITRFRLRVLFFLAS